MLEQNDNYASSLEHAIESIGDEDIETIKLLIDMGANIDPPFEVKLH